MAKASQLQQTGKHRAAARIFESLASDGDEQAMIELGKMYVQGRGVSSDDKVAAKWFSKAADNGNPAAQFELASLYALQSSGIKDYERAAHWYQKAANPGPRRSAIQRWNSASKGLWRCEKYEGCD